MSSGVCLISALAATWITWPGNAQLLTCVPILCPITTNNIWHWLFIFNLLCSIVFIILQKVFWSLFSSKLIKLIKASQVEIGGECYENGFIPKEEEEMVKKLMQDKKMTRRTFSRNVGQILVMLAHIAKNILLGVVRSFEMLYLRSPLVGSLMIVFPMRIFLAITPLSLIWWRRLKPFRFNLMYVWGNRTLPGKTYFSRNTFTLCF